MTEDGESESDHASAGGRAAAARIRVSETPSTLVAPGERRAIRLFWLFLPETSIARNGQFQALLASTFLSDGGRDALKYGALVAVTRSSGSSIDAVLVAVASLVPPTLLGLYGGAVADAFRNGLLSRSSTRCRRRCASCSRRSSARVSRRYSPSSSR